MHWFFVVVVSLICFLYTTVLPKKTNAFLNLSALKVLKKINCDRKIAISRRSKIFATPRQADNRKPPF